MKTINLTQGKMALVDDADFEWLNQYKWCVAKDGCNWYAVRGVGKRPMRMHRLILGFTIGDKKRTDHKDGDGLNNQRGNLRECTSNENMANRKIQIHSSVYKGVSWKESKKKYISCIKVNNKLKYLGSYSSETVAAWAYDVAAMEYFGKFARLNFASPLQGQLVNVTKK